MAMAVTAQGIEVVSLREKKKDKTRLQLLEAALDLIGQQGFNDTTINQIAAAVDVSPRTFLRYFPTKEDVIVSWVQESMDIFLSTLASRPRDESDSVSLIASARELLAAYQIRADFYLTIERVIASEPGMSAKKLAMSATLANKITEILVERKALTNPTKKTTTIHTSELYPVVVFSIIRVVIQHWVAKNGKPKLIDLFEEASALVQLKS